MISLKVFLALTIITGIAYPLLITGVAQIAFPAKANGSLVMKENKVIGSKLIGQQFDSIIYFSSRPSEVFYNTMPSGGTNYGPTNNQLKQLVIERKSKFIAFNQLDSHLYIPSEMLFASASGLDPHISPRAAILQAARVAKARNFNSNQNLQLKKLIKELTETSTFSCLGEERINVLLLNFETDGIR
ncbi:MAG: potassium-transporting ATPase subunit KdpC [Bacteroidales bacterium]